MDVDTSSRQMISPSLPDLGQKFDGDETTHWNSYTEFQN